MAAFFNKRIVKICLLLVVAYIGYCGFTFWKGRNDGFTLAKISTTFPNKPEWEIPLTPETIQAVNKAIKQPFTYLGHGFQFYAFESDDGAYVLKFLRHQRLKPSVFYDWLPNLPLVRMLKERKNESRQARVAFLFQSLKVAYEEIPEETGLVCVHLNKTKNLFGKAHIVDLMEDAHQISLDDTEFVLQRKAQLVKPTLWALMEAGQIKEAKARIDQIFALLTSCAKKGVLDMDRALIRKNNIGFLKDRAIYIDTGKLVRSETINSKERFAYDLKRLQPLYRWLIRHYPPLAVHFEKAQKKALASFE